MIANSQSCFKELTLNLTVILHTKLEWCTGFIVVRR